MNCNCIFVTFSRLKLSVLIIFLKIKVLLCLAWLLLWPGIPNFFLLWLISGLNTNVMKPGDRCMKLWARVKSLDKYLSKRWQTFYKHKIKWKMYWNTNILDNFFLGAGAFIYYWPLSSLHLFLKPYTSVTSVALSWEPSQPNLYFFFSKSCPFKQLCRSLSKWVLFWKGDYTKK